jgi:uncharacterized protein YeaO (DUF488 family)
MSIRIKRVYDPPDAADGRRYLVDRLWPRGRSKEALGLAEWLKDVAPSTELRNQYCHRVEDFPEFRRRYRAELEAKRPVLDRLLRESRSGNVTLLFAARDAEHSNARVLLEFLQERSRGGAAASTARASR